MDDVNWKPRGVHLVGSIPLPHAASVFTTVPASLPNRLQNMPDGETGNRSNFGRWQMAVFGKSPFVLNPFNSQTGQQDDVVLANPNAEIIVLPTGYDDMALKSYREFCQARNQGHIPAGVRFLVSLPTPLNIILGCIRREYQVQCEELYTARLMSALRRIQDEIPSYDLAIQWDSPMEFALLEHLGGRFTPWFSPLREGLVERFVKISNAVDPQVQMGFHFCYGDNNHVHFVEPKDVGLMVEMFNMLKHAVRRQIDWIHMPVPKNRTDDSYFEPLKLLDLGPTELFLGLVHANDEPGTRTRIDVARRFAREFGVSTECGIGRTPPEELKSILEISVLVSTPVM